MEAKQIRKGITTGICKVRKRHLSSNPSSNRCVTCREQYKVPGTEYCVQCNQYIAMNTWSNGGRIATQEHLSKADRKFWAVVGVYRKLIKESLNG